MALDTSGDMRKRFEVVQVAQTIDDVTFQIRYKLDRPSWNLLNDGLIFKVNDVILNSANFNITSAFGAKYGWNRKFNNDEVFGNDNRVIAKAYTGTVSGNTYKWVESSGKQLKNGSTHSTIGYYTQARHVLVGSEEYVENITMAIAPGTNRQATKNVRVHMEYVNGKPYNKDYMGDVTITLATQTVEAPSLPGLTYVFNKNVDHEIESITLTATSNNPSKYYTLSIDGTDKSNKLNSLSVIIPVDKNYYGKTWTYRARISGADQNKVSPDVKIYVDEPIMKIWYFPTDGSAKKQVKRIYYFPTANSPVRINKVAWSNGGSYQI